MNETDQPVDAARRYVALDLESTGFNPYTDRIVEFCFIQLDADLNELGRWKGRVKPTVPFPPKMVEFHGIRDQDVVHLAPFSQIAARAQRLLAPATLLAYNAPFDAQLIHHELRRAGQAGLRTNHSCVDPLDIY